MRSNVSRSLCLALCLLGTGLPTKAADRMIQLVTRSEVSVSYWWMPQNGATATVLLFSGGTGGMGFRDGAPQSQNFLIRSRDEFAKAGFNVALMGNARDTPRLMPDLRQSPQHITDVGRVVEDIRQRSDVPVWLVGTSQGTISAAAAGIALGAAIEGVVLTASLTGQQPGGSVPDLPLQNLQVPVLVHQHAKDSCKLTPPHLAERLMGKLTASRVKKYMLVDGGKNPTGDPCQALHYHGYIGMEAEAVAQIASWIQRPMP